jgi:GTP-binding protein LepA
MPPSAPSEGIVSTVPTDLRIEPASTAPELIRNFCIIAHIDHGKSTLADRMLGITGVVSERAARAQYLDRMDIERERGITIKSQAVRMPWYVDGAPHALNMIDTPGHVDFSYEVSRSLAACEGAILLVDAAQGIEAQTLANLYLAMENDLTIIPVLNKIDLPSADPDRYAAELAQLIGCDEDDVLRVSGKTGIGVPELLNRVVRDIPAPMGDANAPTRAMIFDSVYDTYRGVITYVRVIDGALKPREKIAMMSTLATHDLLEIGVISPEPVPTKGLRVGEVGPGEGVAWWISRPEADGLFGPLPPRWLGLPDPARRPRQVAVERRLARLRARELGRARVRFPLWLSGPAAPGDRARSPRARVQSGTHFNRA